MTSTTTVTIFSSNTCTYCQKAKSRLRSENIAYQEIDIDMYPSKHKAAQEDSKLFTVPVIYFGSKLIGGNDDLQKMTAEEMKDLLLEKAEASQSAIPEFLKINESERGEKEKLDTAATVVAVSGPPEFLKDCDFRIETMNGVHSISYAELASRFTQSTAALAGAGQPGQVNFLDSDVVMAAISLDAVPTGAACSEAALVDLATKMLQSGMIRRKETIPAAILEQKDSSSPTDPLLSGLEAPWTVVANNQLGNVAGKFPAEDGTALFALQHALEGKRSLNRHRLAPTDAPKRDASIIAQELRGRLSLLLGKFMNSEGNIDYGALSRTQEFEDFKDATVELQLVDLSTLSPSRDKLIAFGINVYNSCIVHSFAQHGPPQDRFNNYYTYVGYDIGGYHYSLDDIEHGILRGNSKPCGKDRVAFCREEDPRRHHIVSPVDHRIHFALNCGAKSCPSIKVFSEDDLNNQLQKASLGFLRDATKFNKDTLELETSQLLEWYGVDFGPDPVVTVAGYLEESLKEEVLAAHKGDQGGDQQLVKLKFAEYDWSPNYAKLR